MALSNIILLCQVAGYVIACILSLCIVVPMSLHQDEFRLMIHLFLSKVSLEIIIFVSGDIVYYSLLVSGKRQMGNLMLIGLHKLIVIIPSLLG